MTDDTSDAAPEEAADPADPSVYDHLRPTEAAAADLPAGTYRVVGVHPGDVVLLRVTGPDGRRINEGRVERVPRSRLREGFEPAENPDAGLDLATVRRALNQRALERPIPFAAGTALVVLGTVGESVPLVPDSLAQAATAVGLVVVVAVFVLPGR